MTVEQVPEQHDCPECGNTVRSGDTSDHHTDCPVVTNWWKADYGSEQLCYLCDGWIIEEDHYRMIPLHIAADHDDDLEDLIGAVFMEDRPVCQSCATFRAIDGGKVGEAPTLGR